VALGRQLRIFVVALCVLVPTLCAGQSYDLLLKAVIRGDIAGVGALLDQGLDPNTADADGNSILMTAARLGYRDLTALLIKRKASVARRSPHGDTALMFASLKGQLDIAKLLLENGAEISHGGWTPLHYAAFEGGPDLVKFLIEKGADRNGLAPNGFSPLMLAARSGQLEAARVLLYEDADLTVKGPKGETALGIARERKNTELEALIRRAGAVE
jgi:hypothetical protein